MKTNIGSILQALIIGIASIIFLGIPLATHLKGVAYAWGLIAILIFIIFSFAILVISVISGLLHGRDETGGGAI